MSSESGDRIYSSVEGVSADRVINAVLGDSMEMFRATVEGELFTFSVALVAMERGLTVARAAWGNPGKFVFLQAGDQIFDPTSGEPAALNKYLLWRNDKGEFVPWTPSQDAVLARDWFIGKSGEYAGGSTRTNESPSAVPVQN